MAKRILFISLVAFLLALPLAALAADLGTFGAKVNELGPDDKAVAVAGVKVEVFAGFGYNALYSSAVTDVNGACALKRVPLGKEVLVKLAKAGYVTQYVYRSFSADEEEDVELWIGSDDKINGMFKSLGEVFDPKKGQVLLDISGDTEGIEGVQLAVSSGKVIDIDNGQYLILNAEGASLKVGIQKPGYAFDIESVTIPLAKGAFTQYFVQLESNAGISGSAQAEATSGPISGKIVANSNANLPVAGVSIAFTDKALTNPNAKTVRPAVLTKADGTYSQDGFLFKKKVFVTPEKGTRFKSFKPGSKQIVVKTAAGKSGVNFKAVFK